MAISLTVCHGPTVIDLTFVSCEVGTHLFLFTHSSMSIGIGLFLCEPSDFLRVCLALKVRGVGLALCITLGLPSLQHWIPFFVRFSRGLGLVPQPFMGAFLEIPLEDYAHELGLYPQPLVVVPPLFFLGSMVLNLRGNVS